MTSMSPGFALSIGEQVATIGYAAFYNSRLTTLTIPNSVISIDDNGFGAGWMDGKPGDHRRLHGDVHGRKAGVLDAGVSEWNTRTANLSTAIVAADGTFTLTRTIPASVSLGSHTMVATAPSTAQR